MANFNVAKLKSKFIFVDLAFKCALHFHLDFCLQTIFLPVSVRYTSWSHQSINQSMMCQGYPNMINLSHYADESARKQYEAIPVIWLATQTGKMGPSYSDGIARLDLAQEKDCVERTYQVRDFFSMSAMKSQNSEEKIKHLKTLMVSRSCYKYSSVSFPALEINKSKSFLLYWNFLLYKQSVNDQAFSVKIDGHWPNFFFALLWTTTSPRSIKTQKMNSSNIQPSWPHA